MPDSEVPLDFVLLGSSPPGTEWRINTRRTLNRNYAEPIWIFWRQLSKVYTTEAACLSMGWCPNAWSEWDHSVPPKAQIRETARPFLDMLASRADIFGNHPDAMITVGDGGEKMIDLSSARRIAQVCGWEVPDEFMPPAPPITEARHAPPDLTSADALAATDAAIQQGDALQAISGKKTQTVTVAEGISKEQVLTAFAGLMKNFDLKKALGNGKGLFGESGARTQKGTRGGNHLALWNPVILAIGLNEKYSVPLPHLKRAFFENVFLEKWLDEWKEQLERWTP